MNDFTAIAHQAIQADVDEYIHAGFRPRSLAEQVEESRRAAAGGVG